MHAGERIAVRLRVSRPDGKTVRPGDGSAAVAAFFGPGKDPQHRVSDREPDREVPLVFDEVTRTYGAEPSTAGWQPGTWTVQGKVLDGRGAADGWGWQWFTLEP